MAKHLRRFEVLLPLRFNDGRAVPESLFQQTRREIDAEFGALSVESQVIRGIDRSTGAQEDRLIRIFADVPDTAESLAFFLHLKETLKGRFDQAEIWISTYPVEVI